RHSRQDRGEIRGELSLPSGTNHQVEDEWPSLFKGTVLQPEHRALVPRLECASHDGLAPNPPSFRHEYKVVWLLDLQHFAMYDSPKSGLWLHSKLAAGPD